MSGKRMRFGYWMPVFGGWLRNVEDEGMQPTWDYVRMLAQRSEQIGFDLSLIAELNLNDIKGAEAPSLDAWSTAAALAAVTERLELMVAVRPTFHSPVLFAKQAANVDHISHGRLALNVVSSWWEQEARMYGVDFERHDDRYGRTSEWLDVVTGAWTQKTLTHTPDATTALRNCLRAKAHTCAATNDLCGRRVGSGEESHRGKVRCLRDAWRYSGARCRQDRGYATAT